MLWFEVPSQNYTHEILITTVSFPCHFFVMKITDHIDGALVRKIDRSLVGKIDRALVGKIDRSWCKYLFYILVFRVPILC